MTADEDVELYQICRHEARHVLMARHHEHTVLHVACSLEEGRTRLVLSHTPIELYDLTQKIPSKAVAVASGILQTCLVSSWADGKAASPEDHRLYQPYQKLWHHRTLPWSQLHHQAEASVRAWLLEKQTIVETRILTSALLGRGTLDGEELEALWHPSAPARPLTPHPDELRPDQVLSAWQPFTPHRGGFHGDYYA